MEEILKKITEIAQPLFQNGELDIHQALVIDCNGIKIVRDEKFVPLSVD
nr:MAG TPA: hypothetical protein [Caudoviricetes sp.]